MAHTQHFGNCQQPGKMANYKELLLMLVGSFRETVRKHGLARVGDNQLTRSLLSLLMLPLLFEANQIVFGWTMAAHSKAWRWIKNQSGKKSTQSNMLSSFAISWQSLLDPQNAVLVV